MWAILQFVYYSGYYFALFLSPWLVFYRRSEHSSKGIIIVIINSLMCGLDFMLHLIIVSLKKSGQRAKYWNLLYINYEIKLNTLVDKMQV